MKTFSSLFILSLVSIASYAQWQGTNPVYFNAGNVGIGTSNPQGKLHVTNGSIIASDPIFNDINVRLDGNSIPTIKFTRWTGSPNIYHNAFVGQFWNTTLGQYSFGIGTGSSSDQNTTTNAITITLNGNIGLGTSSPSEKLEIVASGTNNGLRVRNPNEVAGWGISIRQYDDLHGSIECSGRDLQIQPGWTNSLILGSNQMGQNGGKVIFPGGYVGIGTTSPDAPLAVNGQIHATEVKVTITVPGPDYVFEKDYALPSLDSIKTYIDKNKHLPEVPSAATMEKEGIKLGEMNMLLLKKIEELTLLMIKQEKRIKDLENNKNK